MKKERPDQSVETQATEDSRGTLSMTRRTKFNKIKRRDSIVIEFIEEQGRKEVHYPRPVDRHEEGNQLRDENRTQTVQSHGQADGAASSFQKIRIKGERKRRVHDPSTES